MRFKREQAQLIVGLVMRRNEFGGANEWDDVREVCDEETGRELTSSDLDQFTEFVVGRLPRNFVNPERRKPR